MAKVSLTRVSKMAEQTYEIRSKIAALKEKHKEELAPLEESLLESESVLLEMMHMGGLKSSPEVNGHIFTRAVRTSFDVVEGKEDKALEFAKQFNAVAVNRTKLAPILKRALELPEGFAQKETEYLTLKALREIETE